MASITRISGGACCATILTILMFFGEFYQVQSRINGFSITYIPIGRRLREDRLAASGNWNYGMCFDCEIRPDRTEFLSG